MTTKDDFVPLPDATGTGWQYVRPSGVMAVTFDRATRSTIVHCFDSTTLACASSVSDTIRALRGRPAPTIEDIDANLHQPVRAV
ncbi:hypothetical protein [Sagittula salina]|uniref:Uncharacterized protein n=1 Tax=Sagittula salina TaxID=2820268 RepID=A0A940MU17_9RHOB|nr:hypothetical protein [Sagittula salina]MBP0484658.1 hypothetical protein [Sagittula salina]